MIKLSILSKRLREARIKAGYTQIDAAKKLKISNGTLSGYERDYRDPDTDFLNKAADLYGVTVDWLLGRSNDPRLTADQDRNYDQRAEELLKIFDEIEDEKKKEEILKEAVKYVKYLVQTRDEE